MSFDRVRYLAMFKADAEEQLRSFAADLAALDGSRADHARLGSMAREAHTLAGAAMMMGYAPLAEKARAAEMRVESVRAAGGRLGGAERAWLEKWIREMKEETERALRGTDRREAAGGHSRRGGRDV